MATKPTRKQTSTLSKFMYGGSKKGRTSKQMQMIKKYSVELQRDIIQSDKLEKNAIKEFNKALAGLQIESDMIGMELKSKDFSNDGKRLLAKINTVNDAIAVVLSSSEPSEEALKNLTEQKNNFYSELEKTVSEDGKDRKYFDKLMKRKSDTSDNFDKGLDDLVEASKTRKNVIISQKNMDAAKKANFLKDAGVFTAIVAPFAGIFGPLGKDLSRLIKAEEYLHKVAFKSFGGKTKSERYASSEAEKLSDTGYESQSAIENSGGGITASAASSFMRPENDENDKQQKDEQEDFRRENIRIGRERVRNAKEEGGKNGFLPKLFSGFFLKYLGAGAALGLFFTAFGKNGWIGKLLPNLSELGEIGGIDFLLNAAKRVYEFFNGKFTGTEDDAVSGSSTGLDTSQTPDLPLLSFDGKVSNNTRTLFDRADTLKTADGTSIEKLIRTVATKNNIDYGVMMAIAGAESGFKEKAAAGTSLGAKSSASGLFQITADTWKGLTDPTIKGNEARAARLKALGLTTDANERFDATKNAIATAELFKEYEATAQRNNLVLTPGLAYAYHFVGPSGTKLYTADQKALAIDVLGKKAARSNIPIFYSGYAVDPKTKKYLVDKNGDPIGAIPKTVGQVRAYLEGKMSSVNEYKALAGMGTSADSEVASSNSKQLEVLDTPAKTAAAQTSGNGDNKTASFNAAPQSSGGDMSGQPFYILDNGVMVVTSNALLNA